MTIYETNLFKVFRMKVNGVFYFFVGKNIEMSGYLFVYPDRQSAIKCADDLTAEANNGALII